MEIGSIRNFWGYEWKKHGTCFLYIIKDEERSSLSEKQIFRKYFMETVKKVKDLEITLSRGNIRSKKELASKIGLHPSEFYAICGRDDELDEIEKLFELTCNLSRKY